MDRPTPTARRILDLEGISIGYLGRLIFTAMTTIPAAVIILQKESSSASSNPSSPMVFLIRRYKLWKGDG